MGLPLFDRLEARRLFIGGTDGPGADPVALLENGVLTVTDTDDPHHITINHTAAGNIEVKIEDLTNFVLLLQSFKAGDVDLTWVEGLGGDDLIEFTNETAFAGRNYVNAGYGNDTINISGPSINDTFTGAAGNDVIHGGDGDDRLNGGPGKDRIYGENGADRIYGGDSNDNMDGGAGVDRLWGEAANDFLAGGSSNDKLYGGDGNDTLAGGKQDDLLFGELGDDYIYGGEGLNIIDGGIGTDTANHLKDDIVLGIEIDNPPA